MNQRPNYALETFLPELLPPLSPDPGITVRDNLLSSKGSMNGRSNLSASSNNVKASNDAKNYRPDWVVRALT